MSDYMDIEKSYAEALAELTREKALSEALAGETGKQERELARLREENARLVDRHNRESHGTASHEAMAYDDVVRERDRLREALERLIPLCDNCGGTGFTDQKNVYPCEWCTPARNALKETTPDLREAFKDD